MKAPSGPEALSKLSLGALVILAGYVIVVIAARFRYPYELEWMGGAMLDHVERVRDGAPLYGPPSAAWTPFLYPPGYYAVVAMVSRVAPLGAAARGVSIAATLVTAGAGYAIARKLGARPRHASLAPLSFVCAYHYLSDWFDLERVDMLFVALVTSAGAGLLAARRAHHVAAVGAVLAAAFFVKQPAMPFVLAAIGALFVLRDRVGAVALALGATAVFVPIYLYLQSNSGNWFSFYCFSLPARHGVEARFLPLFLVHDLGRAPLFALASAVFLFRAGRDAVATVRTKHPVDRPRFLFAALLGAGLFASASSRMHEGGWPNVLVFWIAFAAPALAFLVEEVTTLGIAALEPAAIALVVAQAAGTAPNVDALVPSRAARADEARIATLLAELDAEGEVFTFGRGNATRVRHAHINAIVDVLRADVGIPTDMHDALAARRYRAFVVNAIHDVDLSYFYGRRDTGLFDVVMRNYYFAARIAADDDGPATGFASVPRFVLFPRKSPLPPQSHEALVARQTIELGIADTNFALYRAGAPRSSWVDVETLAGDKLATLPPLPPR